MDGLIINDEVYKLVKDGEDFDCEDCALYKYCNSLKSPICDFILGSRESHFEKVETNKNLEVPNQTYFY